MVKSKKKGMREPARTEKEVKVEPETIPVYVKKTVTRVNPTVIDSGDASQLKGVIVKWANITEHSELGLFCVAGYRNKSIQILGKMGGGTFDIVGSNCPGSSEFSILVDGDGDNLASLGNTIKGIFPHTYCVKPVRRGGAGMEADIIMILSN